ncbi:unnamed protein product [Mytilus edulis]|uniref:Death domain-containing protein n=1 Tax=Mytilus edulis TaxID=6550 RepID=A0A8S3Q165_MYTED|nr:unnamed protein product [Mytilus edulis]
MTHLDILVEPKRYDQSHSRIPSDFYYVASMVRTSDTTNYLRSSTFGQRNIGLAFCPSSSLIPPAVSFRFISYCLSMFAVKSYGQKNEEMLFHSSSDNPCLLQMTQFQELDNSWICPKHRIEHTKDMLSSWSGQKEDIKCGLACPVTDEEFLEQIPADIHLLRLSMQYTVNRKRKSWQTILGCSIVLWERLYMTFSEEPERLNFETLRKCLDVYNITFNDIRKAAESANHEPEKWDMEPTEEHFDRLAPLVGNNSLAFLVELGMEFQTWEQIRFKQSERDLVKLNRDILQEWKTFCNINIIRPSLRHIGQAFNNIGKI